MRRLKEKWKVSWLQFVLIFCTFAIGGSLCGYAARKILGIASLDKNFIYWILYVVLITILWPIAVILVSIVFGQFSFFKNYLKRISNRILRK